MKILLSFIVALFAVSPAFAQARTERDEGFEFYRRGDYQKAVDSFRTVVEADKKDRRTWFFLAIALARTGKADEAVKAARKGASISEKNQTVAAYDKELKITLRPRVRYTEAARRNLVTGRIRLAVEFGADGRINAILPIGSLPDGLTENCVEAAGQIKFEPAVKDEKPVTVIRIIEYSFDIY